MFRLERVGNVLEKDQPQDDVLVLGRVHVVAQRIGGLPELGFKPEVRGGIVLLGFASHQTALRFYALCGWAGA